jgi:hypothetical protein
MRCNYQGRTYIQKQCKFFRRCMYFQPHKTGAWNYMLIWVHEWQNACRFLFRSNGTDIGTCNIKSIHHPFGVLQKTSLLCSRSWGHGWVATALGPSLVLRLEWHISIQNVQGCDQNGTDIKTRNIKLIHYPLDVGLMKKISAL